MKKHWLGDVKRHLLEVLRLIESFKAELGHAGVEDDEVLQMVTVVEKSERQFFDLITKRGRRQAMAILEHAHPNLLKPDRHISREKGRAALEGVVANGVEHVIEIDGRERGAACERAAGDPFKLLGESDGRTGR